ncbi:MAG: hypothetical protein JWL70_1027, partial [Acidimicrobiia bacterium]|nr:hypothetical protein [Acidimicrobiia bacterium]
MAEKPKVVRRVEDKIDRAADAMAPHDAGRGASDGGTEAERRYEQQREAQQSWTGEGLPGMAAMTQGQFRGLWFGSLVGGLIGAVIGLAVGFIPWGSLDLGWRLLITAALGAIAGSTAW